jgi:NAD(P)H-quinone oxidoreductase subunit 5
MLLTGLVLHLPLVMKALQLPFTWSTDLGLLLIWSSINGASISALLYFNPNVKKPIRILWKPLQNLFAYDFYTPRLYRASIVFGVDVISRITDWFDRYLVDGLVNFVGIASIFSGETLKYGNTGRTQFYLLTISFWVALIAILMNWAFLSQQMSLLLTLLP